MEIFKDIPGYPGYQVSNLGNVKSFKYDKVKGKTLVPTKAGDGYLKVGLRFNNKTHQQYIHRLVATVFLSGQSDEVNHKDGNKQNNRVDNLEWCTSSENKRHAYVSGLNNQDRNKRPVYKVCLYSGDVLQRFESIAQAAMAMNCSRSSISHACNGRNKTAHGFKWVYEI